MKSDLDETRDKKIENKVYRLRHREGLTWNDVADKVSKELDLKITAKKAQEIYDKHISRASIMKAQKQNAGRKDEAVKDAWKVEMEKMMEEVKRILVKHIRIADNKLVEQSNDGLTNAYFRNLPALMGICRTTIDQINLISKRNENLEKMQMQMQRDDMDDYTKIMKMVNKAHDKKAKEQGYIIHPGTGELVKTN